VTRYATASAFRQALEGRLARRAAEEGLALDRLRRWVLFERILVRLASNRPDAWVLKGGFALEVRLAQRARATRDLDMATRLVPPDAGALHELLVDALANDPEDDRFVFSVAPPAELRDDDAGRPGWRASVEGRLAGRQFGSVRVDVVARPQEISSTEWLAIPSSLAFDGFPAHEFETVSAAQHFAEKLHALTRDYGRENTRSRDLLDLVLLIEGELVRPGDVMPAVRLVFAERRAQPVPQDIADPPAGWDDIYEAAAAELTAGARTVPAAMTIVREFWAEARRQEGTTHREGGRWPGVA
jgi:predicted nucleotidyltransferase component of viral defense system